MPSRWRWRLSLPSAASAASAPPEWRGTPNEGIRPFSCIKGCCFLIVSIVSRHHHHLIKQPPCFLRLPVCRIRVGRLHPGQLGRQKSLHFHNGLTHLGHLARLAMGKEHVVLSTHGPRRHMAFEFPTGGMSFPGSNSAASSRSLLRICSAKSLTTGSRRTESSTESFNPACSLKYPRRVFDKP